MGVGADVGDVSIRRDFCRPEDTSPIAVTHLLLVSFLWYNSFKYFSHPSTLFAAPFTSCVIET